MKEEVARIMRLVADGKISPDDAAELIEAMDEARRQDDPAAPALDPPSHGSASEAPPRANATAAPPSFEADARAAFRSVVDNVERLARQAQDEARKVDWRGVAAEARQNARKGLDALRTGIEEASGGKVNLGWLLNDSVREVRLPLALPAGATLKIENECGDVRVVGGDAAGEVTAYVKVRAENAEEAKRLVAEYALVLEENDDAVRIRQAHAPGLSVRIAVALPEAARVEASADSGDVLVQDCRGSVRAISRTGDVSVAGAEGHVEARSETGDLHLTSIGGGATLETGTGDISVAGLRGDVRARASSGDVSLVGLAAGDVEAETISGDIAIVLCEGIGKVAASSVSGDVSASIPAASGGSVELTTLRGQARCDLPLRDERRTPGRIEGRLGGDSEMAGGSVRLHSVSGSVSLSACA